MMQKTTIFFLSLSIVFLLISGGGSWYILSSIDHMQNELTEKEDALQKEEDRQRMVLDVRKQLKRIEAERSEIGQYFFKESEIIQMIEQLENLARHAKVELDVTTATPAGEGKNRVFRIGLKTRGSWQDSQYYLALLETLPLRIRMTRAGFAGGDAGAAWTGDIAFDLLSFVPNPPQKP